MSTGLQALHVVHTIGSVVAEAAGPSYSVRRLAQQTADNGCEVDLCSVGEPGSQTNGCFVHRQFAANLQNLPVARRLMMSRAMQRFLQRSDADVFHNHGLWLMPNVYAGVAASKTGKPLVVSPRGMLAPPALDISPVPKTLFASVFRRPMLEAASVFHATGEQEMQDIRSYGLRQPVAVIPNGVDLPDLQVNKSGETGKSLLYFGRLHPIKNLEVLLRAWKVVEPHHPTWSLQVCGPGDTSYAGELKGLVQSQNIDRVQFLDPVYGDAKNALYQKSAVYVLPSKSENFAMTVAEALANGVPVITNKGAPWSQVETKGCGWWVDHGQDSLVAAIDEALSLPASQLAKMGARGRVWMEEAYGWEAISQQMTDVYRWTIDRQEQPESLWMN